MASIRNLNGVAAGILGSFVSRNNDSNGYWAVGQLRALAADRGWTTVQVCLQPIAEHDSALLEELAGRYRAVLDRLLLAAGLSPRTVCMAKVVVRFQLKLAELQASRILPTTWGTPFSCKVVITDARGRLYWRERFDFCAPHDPSRELRSTRARAV